MEMKNYVKSLLIISVILAAGCGSQPYAKPQATAQGCDLFDECGDETTIVETSEPVSFARQYEAYNGKETKKGKVYRTVSLADDTPFTDTTAEAIVQRLADRESFYLYVGDPMCPWCRSVIEQAEAVAGEKKIAQIVSLRIWDENGEEILRDQYVLEDGKPVLKKAGSAAYQTFLSAFQEVLDDYTLKDEAGEEIAVGEKRIYAPSFFRVENGEVTAFTTGISPLQTDAYEPLSAQMLTDEKEQFEDFFKEDHSG